MIGKCRSQGTDANGWILDKILKVSKVVCPSKMTGLSEVIVGPNALWSGLLDQLCYKVEAQHSFAIGVPELVHSFGLKVHIHICQCILYVAQSNRCHNRDEQTSGNTLLSNFSAGWLMSDWKNRSFPLELSKPRGKNMKKAGHIL